jgi:hypothetical protein
VADNGRNEFASEIIQCLGDESMSNYNLSLTCTRMFVSFPNNVLAYLLEPLSGILSIGLANIDVGTENKPEGSAYFW